MELEAGKRGGIKEVYGGQGSRPMFRRMEMQIVNPCVRICLVIRAIGLQELITRCQSELWSLEFSMIFRLLFWWGAAKEFDPLCKGQSRLILL